MKPGTFEQQISALLIKCRDDSGLTKKKFAKQPGITQQQLQRYEANNFGSVTFNNLLPFLEAVGLEIIAEVKLARTINIKPRKKQSTK